MLKCAKEQYLSNEGSTALLDLVKGESRCFKADPKPSIRSVGTSIRCTGTDGSSHTRALAGSLGPVAIQLVLLSSGREDECFTVYGETNISSLEDSVSLWSCFQARRVGVDGGK